MRYVFVLILLAFLAGISASRPEFENPVKSDPYFFSAGLIFGETGSSDKNDGTAPDLFENLKLEAESAVVVDLSDDKIIFKKNSDAERPLASLTKLVTASVVYEIGGDLLREGVISIPITSDAILQEGDDGFLAGESFNAGDLQDAMLVKSSNDAAYALSAWAKKNEGTGDNSWFINEMNMLVSRLGLQKTYFLNSTGLDIDDRISGSYGTAGEMVRLFSWLVKNRLDVIAATSRSQIAFFSNQGKRHVFDSSAGPIMQIPELIAAKTGYTDLAGGNLVFAFGSGPGRQFAAVVLGSSYNGRFEDAIKLYEAASKYSKSP